MTDCERGFIKYGNASVLHVERVVTALDDLIV